MKPGSEGTVQAKLTRGKLASWNREKLCSLDGAAQTCVLLSRALVYFSGEKQEGGELMKTMGVRQL